MSTKDEFVELMDAFITRLKASDENIWFHMKSALKAYDFNVPIRDAQMFVRHEVEADIEAHYDQLRTPGYLTRPYNK